jgi:hypothetical protein
MFISNPQKNWAFTNVRWVVVFVGKNQCWVVCTFSVRTFKVSSPILRGFLHENQRFLQKVITSFLKTLKGIN